jgi:hypothetical protein
MIIHEFIEYCLYSALTVLFFIEQVSNICLQHYLLLMVNVLKSNESITAAGMLCLILHCLFLGLTHVLFKCTR